MIDGQSSSQERIPTKSEHDEPDSAPNDPEQGFEFRLFATPTSRQPTGSHPADGIAPRIILDDEPDAGDPDRQGGFVVPRRDEGYYFTSTVAPAWGKERRRQFEIAAVSGEDVRRCLGVRYTGWEVRWRVRHLRNGELVIADANEKGVVASPLTAGLGPNGQGGVRLDGERKKGKLGKKRRIILRMRKRKGEEAAERKKREERERGEAEREKRTRRNREKKVKKKMREKEKKGKGENDTAGIDGASGG